MSSKRCSGKPRLRHPSRLKALWSIVPKGKNRVIRKNTRHLLHDFLYSTMWLKPLVYDHASHWALQMMQLYKNSYFFFCMVKAFAELVRAGRADKRPDRSIQDDYVPDERPILDVVKIESNAVFPREVGPTTHLPEPGDSGLH